MESLPVYVHLLFVAVTVLSIFLFYRSAKPSKIVLAVLFCWLVLQSFLSLNGFYTKWNAIPPRLLFLLVPPIAVIASMFVMPRLRMYLDNMNEKSLTLIHVVRIPVEITLLFLFLHNAVPQLMTFEGRNFDIISGITAPLVMYFGYVKKKMNKGLLLAWNFICLGLLLNIVVNAILSMPTPFQKFAADQPNIAVAYFPFIWLPSFIVPLVLFAHLVSIRHLLKSKAQNRSKEASVVQQVITG